MNRQQRRKMEREKRKQNLSLISSQKVKKNLKSLKDSLIQSKQGNGHYSEMINKNNNRDEFIELINKSLVPDHKKGIVNTGTSMKPNIYTIEDTPIWIDGDMGSIWFDCKTRDGDFWRISLEDGRFFHVEDLQYYFIYNHVSMLSQISGEPIPTRTQIYEHINTRKSVCDSFTRYELIGNEEVKIHRDLINEGYDMLDSSIRKVKGGYEYFDKGWGTGYSPRLYKDIDRLIWEFDLPKTIKKQVSELIEVPKSVKIGISI